MPLFPRPSGIIKPAIPLAAAILLTGLGASVSQAQLLRGLGKTSTPKYLATSRVVQVPVHLDRALIPKLKEVCLCVKEGAQEWKCVIRTAPNVPSIIFEAPRDGEYAFHIVTVDYMGKTLPPDLASAPPTMIVIIDTRQTKMPGAITNAIRQVSGTTEEPMVLALVAPEIRDSFAPPLQEANGLRASMPKRQYLNSSRVGLDYTIGKMGPSGVSKIDVYVTSEHEASWKRLGTIADPSSHSEIDLPGEGLFGIRLVATNGNGFGGEPPGPNDLPTALFEIDMTGPQLKVDIDPVNKNAVLDIHWQVSDKNLGAEPIQISYAVQPGSPWQPVAKVKNDGVYHWAIPRNMPANFIIRVEAFDLAGNVSRADSANPVPLDLTRPDVNLLGLAAVPVRAASGDSGRK